MNIITSSLVPIFTALDHVFMQQKGQSSLGHRITDQRHTSDLASDPYSVILVSLVS